MELLKALSKNVLRKLLKSLFPERASGRRVSFDFSRAPPQRLALSLPRACYIKGLTPITACLSYKHPLVRTLVWNIKTKKDHHAAACASYILSEKIKELLQKKHSLDLPVIIPIPIHSKRLKERGYNQCELIARKTRSYCEIEIRTDILVRNYRRENAKKQAFKKRSERIAGMQGAFTANLTRIGSIPNLAARQIIIIDDVLTTGSTMREAISTLEKAGCKNIHGLALAH